MNAPMHLSDLKPRMILRYDIDGEILDLFVCDIEKSDGHIEGTVWNTPGRYGERHSLWVRPTDELEIYSSGGARLYPGITKAEIEAWEVYARAKAAGLEPVVEITREDHHLAAHVRIPGKTMFHETIHATWYTYLTGRRTTRYAYGFEIRGALRSKKYKRAVSVKLSKQKFFQALGDVCFVGEYEKRKEHTK